MPDMYPGSRVLYVITLPFTKPPLTLNQRQPWMVKAELTKQVRNAAMLLALSARVPKGMEYIEVTLHYRPNTKRKRDEDNLFATLKPCLDGLRDAGVIIDDDHTHVTSRCRIEKVGRDPALWLSIEDLT